MVASSAQLPPRPCPPLAPGAELPKPAPAHLAPAFVNSNSFGNGMVNNMMGGGLPFLAGLGDQQSVMSPMSPMSPLTLVPLAALPPLTMSTNGQQQNGASVVSDAAVFMNMQQTLAQLHQMQMNGNNLNANVSPLAAQPPNTPMMPPTPTSNASTVAIAAQQLQQLQQAQFQLQQLQQAQQAQLLQLQMAAGLPLMAQLISAIQAHPALLHVEELGFLRDFLATQNVDINSHRFAFGGSNPASPATMSGANSTTATSGSSLPATSPASSSATPVSATGSAVVVNINPPTPTVTVTNMPTSVSFGGRLEVPHEGMRGATPDSQASESTQGMSSCGDSRASTPACGQFGLEMGQYMPFDVPSSISACWDSPRSNLNASPIEGINILHSATTNAAPVTSASVVKPSPQRPTAAAGMKLKGAQVPQTNLFGEEPAGAPTDDAEKDKALIDPRKYKTRMCRNWMQTGACSYEHTCCFAHGEAELRDPAANVVVLSSLGYFTTKRLRDGVSA